MAAEVVHDDDVAGAERRYEELLDISEEDLTVDWSIEHAWGIDPVVAQRGKEGQRAPVTEGDLGVQPLATRGAAVGAGHVGLGPGLVDEDEARRIKPVLVLAPLHPPAGDGGTILLAGEQAFF